MKESGATERNPPIKFIKLRWNNLPHHTLAGWRWLSHDSYQNKVIKMQEILFEKLFLYFNSFIYGRK